MLSVAWPVGLILLISKLSDSSGKKSRAPRQTSSQAQPKVQQTMQQVTKTPVYTDKSAKTMKIVGIILAALGGVTLLSGLGSSLAALLGGGSLWTFLSELFYPAGMLASGPGGPGGRRASAPPCGDRWRSAAGGASP